MNVPCKLLDAGVHDWEWVAIPFGKVKYGPVLDWVGWFG